MDTLAILATAGRSHIIEAGDAGRGSSARASVRAPAPDAADVSGRAVVGVALALWAGTLAEGPAGTTTASFTDVTGAGVVAIAGPAGDPAPDGGVAADADPGSVGAALPADPEPGPALPVESAPPEPAVPPATGGQGEASTAPPAGGGPAEPVDPAPGPPVPGTPGD